MRKKSHISLARGLMNCYDSKKITKHKLTFCAASIWPDCRPSFLTTPHRIDKTFSKVKENIRTLIDNNSGKEKLSTGATAHIGVILHYIADYFTFPHNIEYTGNLKDHVYYEKDLKFAIRKYINDGGAYIHKLNSTILDTPEKLSAYVQKRHAQYLKKVHTLEHDVQYILQVCADVFASILFMLGFSELTEA